MPVLKKLQRQINKNTPAFHNLSCTNHVSFIEVRHWTSNTQTCTSFYRLVAVVLRLQDNFHVNILRGHFSFGDSIFKLPADGFI